jgi:hypothetical protein
MVEVNGAIFFMDGTKMTLSWPRPEGNDPSTIATAVKNALDSDKLMAVVDGYLLVIPMRNIKYIQITPAPEKLPTGVVRGAQLVG